MPRKGLAVMILLALAGNSFCGYRVASTQRSNLGIESVSVQPLVNTTSTYEVEQILTRSLIAELVERTGYRVVSNPSGADAVMSGIISRVTASPVTFGSGSFGSTFLVTLTASLELKERSSGKILFKNDRYTFREQYVINTEIEDFFSELNPAIDRIARDFAASVVSSIIEGF